MTEQETVLLIKGTIASLPDVEREKVVEAYKQLRQIVDGNPYAQMAIALIGAELSV